MAAGVWPEGKRYAAVVNTPNPVLTFSNRLGLKSTQRPIEQRADDPTQGGNRRRDSEITFFLLASIQYRRDPALTTPRSSLPFGNTGQAIQPSAGCAVLARIFADVDTKAASPCGHMSATRKPTPAGRSKSVEGLTPGLFVLPHPNKTGLLTQKRSNIFTSSQLSGLDRESGDTR
jgi:hypothetical protein